MPIERDLRHSLKRESARTRACVRAFIRNERELLERGSEGRREGRREEEGREGRRV